MEGFGKVMEKTGGGHAQKIIKSGFLSDRNGYNIPPVPLTEGRLERRNEYNTPLTSLVEGNYSAEHR